MSFLQVNSVGRCCDEEVVSLPDIGELLGISHQRVRQLASWPGTEPTGTAGDVAAAAPIPDASVVPCRSKSHV
nr:hypothetical protein [Rhodococcus erythropolis]